MVLDAFAKVVSQADTRGEYLSENQVNALIAFVKDGNKRVDVVNRLSSNSSAIVTDAARSLFSEQPVLVAPGGNAYTNRRAAACLRDLEIILRYVTYATFTGDASILDDRALNGLRETYVALGVPGAAILISKSNNLYRQKKRFNRWQNRDRQSVLDGCNFSYSVIMRVMTFLVGVLKSASSIKMRIAVPGASVAAGILKLKDASLALAADPNGITRGDCSSLLAEVASYFDRAAAAVS